ncbi:tRNA pseudouridine(55) synthase TruB [Corynebacterium heidelbergense]|uniref:tRNA pseudouridine synthase B n=1 Tax=Corynebacterium heidelbergense TaxID=2055947 RepID=A0A364V850_9CORY|nr:tRNA pseudouridine(55) synthase TruB [Corynebacterium heidelbergense]RAV32801.1 tRNA pseudouridine(55) synthase TruB [Corynebacterium heidelbergense]WCZ36714.1 tRNA pseudouridine synthase B [Corynebacterium heidelbergense]
MSETPSSADTAAHRPPEGGILQRSGVLVVDKPAGMTSHDVIARLRRIFGTRRVGHAGTLDPMATGVLVVGIERGTKFLAHVVAHNKRYEATAEFGATTVTEDCESAATSIAPAASIRALRPEAVATALTSFCGDIEQRPSSVSAVKINGKRAHELVRAGKDVQLPARPVSIHSLTVDQVELLERSAADAALVGEGPRWRAAFAVHCSSGTFVRALARDAGEALGVGGYLTQLRRVSSGPFPLAEAQTLEQLAARPVLTWTLDEAMARCFPVREISEPQARDLALGKWLEPIGLQGVHAAVGPRGRAIALIEERGSRAASVFVARPAGMD